MVRGRSDAPRSPRLRSGLHSIVYEPMESSDVTRVFEDTCARAEAVRDCLRQAGVDAARLTACGHGESHPGASDMSANGVAQSRRVELRVQER